MNCNLLLDYQVCILCTCAESPTTEVKFERPMTMTNVQKLIVSGFIQCWNTMKLKR